LTGLGAQLFDLVFTGSSRFRTASRNSLDNRQ